MQLVQDCTPIVLFVFTIASLPAVSSIYLRAVFDMSDIKGEIKFTRYSNGHTRISTNLSGLTSNLTWQVHKYPVVYRGNRMHTCNVLYTGGMYDPTEKSFGENYKTRCNETMQSMCAIGDLSGKHGHLNSATDVLLDPYLPISGPDSIFGRTVVFYRNGSTPWACALIDYDDVITAVTTFRGASSGVTGRVRFRQPRGNASSDTSVEVNLFYSNDVKMGSYNLTLEIADTRLPEEGIPSFEGDHCKITPTRLISNQINVPLASNGPSTERLLFSAKNLPLSGSMSVISQTLVLKHNGIPIICGSVYEVVPIEAEAVFDVDGVKGSFHFKQDSDLSPTVVTADLKGLKSKSNTYHVHVYRVLDSVMQSHENDHAMCGNKYVAGHWKPYNTKSAEPGNGTVDKYEVGDLSGKYGTIGAKDTLSLVRKDYNLPLFGGNSILFRSMVLHYAKDGSRWVCTNINPKDETFRFKVKTEFPGPDFNGTVIIEQASFVKTHGASHITTFFLDLTYKDSKVKTKEHKWHVHDKDIVGDQMMQMGKRCKSADAHYNPYKVSLGANYSATCDPKNLLRCELGDVSSKVGKYNIGWGKNRFTESENYFAGVNTILGRSIVVHAKDSGAPRAGCANMKLISDSFVRKELFFLKTTASQLSKPLAAALEVNHWRVIHDKEISNYKEKCQKTSFLLIDSTGSDLGQKYEDLKKDWPESLKDFKPVSEDECSRDFTMESLPDVSSGHLRAVFDMSDIKGEIKFTRYSNGHTRISTNLSGLTSNLTWQIHKYPVVYRGNRMHTCNVLYTGGMYDPTEKSSDENYKTRCNEKMQSMCAIGDLSGKHGHLNSATDVLLDPYLPNSGPDSIFGRTVVFYTNGSTPWACALIDYDDVITAVTTFRGASSGVTGRVRLRQPRGNASSDTSVEVNLFYSNDVKMGSYNLTLEIADKRLPEEGIPSFEGDHCKITPTRLISNQINVPLASNGPSTERLLFSAKNLPLSGSMSVISQTLVLKHNGIPIICGSVYEVVPIEAEAVFDVDGVKGSFHFKQDSELSPTVVTADLKGLKSKSNTYHVHVYRVLDSVMQSHENDHAMCGNKYVAGHWKPYNTKSAEPGKGTVDKYEVGDLSGKYGTIGAKDTLSLVRKDYNLPLFGGNSILFRSMVLHYAKDGSRWVCTNINPKNETFRFKVKTEFPGPDFNGTVIIEQASFVKKHGASHITTFFLDLTYKDSKVKTKEHKWHVHDKDIVGDQMMQMGKRCKSADAHYNPYKVSLGANYSTTCGPKNLLRCELGDVSSKVGKYNIGWGKNRFTESENYFAGVNTILGRSIVVHAKNSGAPRAGCANMKLISDSFVRKELVFLKTTASQLSQPLAAALEVNHWRVIHDKEINNYKEKCQKTSFLLINSTDSDLGQKYEDLKKDWPESLKDFKPVSEDGCSHAISLHATSLVLIIGFLLSHLLV